jgi:hypothetical protein
MENQTQSPYDSPFLKPDAPYSSSAQVMGILSIVFAWVFTLAGLILGIIAVVHARKAKDIINANPNAYNPYSMSKVKTGRTTGIVGIVLSALVIIALIAVILIAVAVATQTHSCHPYQSF